MFARNFVRNAASRDLSFVHSFTSSYTAGPPPTPIQSVTLDDDTGLISIINNLGEDFTVDASVDAYDGTFSVTEGDLEDGPVALVSTAIIDDGSPEVGETLVIQPPFVAYNPSLGDVVITYTTNSLNSVDDSDPAAPTLVVHASDINITVTAVLTQGVYVENDVSAAVAIGAGSTPLSVTHLTTLSETTNTASLTFSSTFDLSGFAVGDVLCLSYGTNSASEPALTVNGNAATYVSDGGDPGRTGGRIHGYTYTLQAGDLTSGIAVAISGGTSATSHIVNASVVEGIPTASDYYAECIMSLAGGDNDMTIATTDNVIVAHYIGRTSYTSGDAHAWGGVTQDGSVLSTAGRSTVNADNSGVATGTHNVSFTPNPGASTSDEGGLTIFAFSK